MYMYVYTNVATYVPAWAWSVNMCECPAAAESKEIHMIAQLIFLKYFVKNTLQDKHLYSYMYNDTTVVLLHTIIMFNWINGVVIH